MLSETYGYDSLRGPRYFGADASLAKNFTLTEKAKLQFRADIYNVFNHPILGLQPEPGREWHLYRLLRQWQSHRYRNRCIAGFA